MGKDDGNLEAGASVSTSTALRQGVEELMGSETDSTPAAIEPVSKPGVEVQEQPEEQSQEEPAGDSTEKPETEEKVEEPPSERSFSEKELDEAVRRRVQSVKDKQAHQEQIAQLAREREEQVKVDEKLSDEEYGRVARERARKTNELGDIQRRTAIDVRQKDFASFQELLLKDLPEDTLSELNTRLEKGEFDTLEKFAVAAIEAHGSTRVTKELKKREKSMREAVRNELTAERAKKPSPVAGAGLTSVPVDVNKMSRDQKLRAGVDELFS